MSDPPRNDTNMDPPPPAGSIAGDFFNVCRGFCMGAADTVPGVSGGTIALILGHYQRLIVAVSHFDKYAVRCLVSGRLRDFARHIDFRFLLFLGIGILLGAVSLASSMHWLLEHQLAGTLAVFLGLVLASSYIVGRGIRKISGSVLSSGIIAFFAALEICVLPAFDASFRSNPIFLFFAGMIAICAMILPGISGAFVLVLLGVYSNIIEMIKDLPMLIRDPSKFDYNHLVSLSMFGMGCLIGLALFSRVLRKLLVNFPDATMAALVGLMFGSVLRLWPLQAPTPETVGEKFRDQNFELFTPWTWPGTLWAPILL
ncbi:MAG: DUF368 domain-containing protein, partial [Planctomycetota bacterium]